MDIGVLIGIFIAWPLLALIPAAAFGAMYAQRRRRIILITALTWAVYFFYELGIKMQILCSAECNIRVDLLLLYPILAILSLIAVVSYIRAGRTAVAG